MITRQFSHIGLFVGMLPFVAACTGAPTTQAAVDTPIVAVTAPTISPSSAPTISPSPQSLNLPQFVWRVNGDRNVFFDPGGMALDAQGKLYVWDGGHVRVQVFDSDGKMLTYWGSRGDADGQFGATNHHPWGSIAIDPQGNIYVPDLGNHRVQKFDSQGKFISKWGKHGDADGEFVEPYGIAIDRKGHVYVIDGTARLQVFDNQGQFLSKFGGQGSGDGQFQSPTYITVDRRGNIYVPDSDTGRIQKFNSDGTLIAKWNATCGDSRPMNPNSIAIDGQGNAYVTDIAQARICKFDSQGRFLLSFGSHGVGNGELTDPAGILVDEQGNIYVSGALPPFVQKFTAIAK